MAAAALVKCWEDVFDKVGAEEAMELFMTVLLRDARAEHAQRSQKEEEDDEEEEPRARVFEPWHPPPPRVERTVVLALPAPPHLLPRKHERTTTSAPAADLARPAKKCRGGL